MITRKEIVELRREYISDVRRRIDEAIREAAPTKSWTYVILKGTIPQEVEDELLSHGYFVQRGMVDDEGYRYSISWSIP